MKANIDCLIYYRLYTSATILEINGLVEDFSASDIKPIESLFIRMEYGADFVKGVLGPVGSVAGTALILI